MAAPQRILVVQTGFLGDIVLSTPVLQRLREAFPETVIDVLTTPAAQELVQAHPAVTHALAYDKRGGQRGWKGLQELAAQLRQNGYQIALSLHKSWRTAALLRLADIPQRIGFREAAGSFFYHRTVRRAGHFHEVERNLCILSALGLPHDPSSARMSLGVPEEAVARVRSLHLNAPPGTRYAALAPGSVWATKQWTAHGFAAVGEGLHERGFRVLLLGGPGDVEAGRRVKALIGAPVKDLIGQTSLLESVAIIRELDLLVCNDSAPLHIACAVETPVVAAFCATVPEFGFGPWTDRGCAVGVEGLTCRPCARHGGSRCPTGTHACQIDLKPEAVLFRVDQLRLHQPRGGNPASPSDSGVTSAGNVA